MKRNLAFRSWYYFRMGWATYFAFIFAAVNTLTVTYFLAIENYPSLQVVFPSLVYYIVIVSLIGVPLLYLIGSLITKNNVEKYDDGITSGLYVQLIALFLHFYNVYDAIISSNNINKAYYDKYLETQQKEEASN